MRLLATVAIAMLVIAAASAHGQTPIPVPSDPSAGYDVISLVRKPAGRIELLTRRRGRSGTSYVLREIDCSSSGFPQRYLGEGDSQEAAMARRSAPGAMVAAVPNSISGYIAQFACSR